jgi:hypothetical protein
LIARSLSKAAGVDDLPVRWRMIGGGPWFDNQVAMLHVDGRRIDFQIEKAVANGGSAELDCVLEHRLA